MCFNKPVENNGVMEKVNRNMNRRGWGAAIVITGGEDKEN
jgi:hypothetical protein